MTSSQFLIGPVKDGVRKDLKPFAIPEDAFPQMVNAFTYLSRVRRRQGYFLLGRLAQEIVLGNAGASAANFSVNLFTQFLIANPTANVVPGSITITIAGGGGYTLQDTGDPGEIIQTGGGGVNFTSGTINYLTSDLNLMFAVNPAAAVIITFAYALNLPVMGLKTRDLYGINQQDNIAFDTQLAYRYNNTTEQFELMPSTMPVVWSGTDSQFFFTTNYANSLWATNSKPGVHGFTITGFGGAAGQSVDVTTAAANNFAVGDQVYFVNVTGAAAANNLLWGVVTAAGNPFTILIDASLPAPVNGVAATGIALTTTNTVTGEDGIRYYTGTTWANYAPPITPTTALFGALMIFPYRGYLVFLSTTEGDGVNNFSFPNRARWTQIGTPYYQPPVPTTPAPVGFDFTAARSDIFGKGGFSNSPTNDIIVSAGFIKDILVVFFQRSTWRLRFTNNSINPFVWERVNVELGSNSTFSAIVFDKGLMAIGNRGIVISDSNDTVRIDEKIPEEVFEIRNNNDGPERIHGIRTFKTRLNYWTFPSNDNPQGIFPDKVLVFNYFQKTWSFFDDTFTTFGYFYPFDDLKWGDLRKPWASYTNLTWGSSNNTSFYENVVAGNQQGFVFVLEEGVQNEASLNITALTAASPGVFTVVNHNLVEETWIKLTGIAGVTQDDGVDLNGRNFRVKEVVDADNITLQEFASVNAGTAAAAATAFAYTLSPSFTPVLPTSVQINVGSIVFTDPLGDGILQGDPNTNSGTINYETGAIVLAFSPALAAPTDVIVRVVAGQNFADVNTVGTYTGGGYITKISNIQVQSKVFNFFPQNQKSRISSIDFYVESTEQGEFTCDIFGDSNTTLPLNMPLPDNKRSNVVLTSENVYQIIDGSDTVFRLYCDAVAQTIQFQIRLSDSQMAVDSINSSNVEINAMMVKARAGGRLV